jgi:hypothetical protein
MGLVLSGIVRGVKCDRERQKRYICSRLSSG